MTRPAASDARGQAKQEAKCIRLLALLTIATAVFSTATAAARSHHPECRTARCRVAADRAWARHHPPRFRFTAFELCVANRESGEPGSISYNTIRWDYVGEGYEGAYNWVNSTWLAMGGGKYAQHANEASPKDQTLIFRAHANPHDWPLTVPACYGYGSR